MSTTQTESEGTRRIANRIRDAYTLTEAEGILIDYMDENKLSDSQRFDYNRLKQLELRGMEEYQKMRNAPALTPERVVALINQLSPWNLKTTGLSVLEAYVAQEKVEHAEYVIGEDVEMPIGPRAAGKSYAFIGNKVRAEQRKRAGLEDKPLMWPGRID